MKYAVVIERAAHNFSAYVPDLPGCVSTGKTRSEVRRNITEAIEFHLDGLAEDGLPIPPAETTVDVIPIPGPHRKLA
jgi:predicted RNase H-like HicB family nuclease